MGLSVERFKNYKLNNKTWILDCRSEIFKVTKYYNDWHCNLQTNHYQGSLM